MPPRYTYWTIILEGKPTAFRARTEEELLPTLKQLQARHPDAVLKWFSRGKLWHSPEEERLARAARDAAREKRGRDWRPGGTHRDPRERFQIPRDERRRRFRERLIRDRSQMPPPPGEPQPPNENDQDRRPAPPRRPSSAAGKRPWKPSAERKGPWKPSRESEGKRPWKPKEQRPWKPAGPGGRPPGPGGRPPRRSFGGPGKPGGGRRGGGGGGGGQGGPRGGGRGGGGRGGGGRGGGPR